MSEIISQHYEKFIAGLFLLASVFLTWFLLRRKHQAEIAQFKANTRKSSAESQKIEIDLEIAEKTRDSKVLSETIESMSDLVEYVEKMGGKVIKLEQKVSALEKENMKVVNERDTCKTLCTKLKTELGKVSKEVTRLKDIMKKHNIPAEGH